MAKEIDMGRKNTSRTLIMDAGEKIFSEKGYFPARMEEIAVEAGVAKGTLYYNFPSKAGLFESIITEGQENGQVEKQEIVPFLHSFISSGIALEETK